MRATYRDKNNKDYWTKRWSDIDADLAMLNNEKYPLKYSKMLIQDKKDKMILEAGCGAGRILRYYHNNGYNIIGIDFIKEAIKKLLIADKSLKAQYEDIRSLSFSNDFFDYVLAFGLYHNFQSGPDLQKSISETRRVLKTDGYVCASFRADNLQNKIVDYLHLKKQKNKNKKDLYFHKLNLTKEEFKELFQSNGFKVEKLFAVENMPFLYKFNFFRSNNQKSFNENKARIEGYQLSVLGKILQKFLIKFFPDQFCNIYLIIAKKIN